jgi:hypothetical protein
MSSLAWEPPVTKIRLPDSASAETAEPRIVRPVYRYRGQGICTLKNFTLVTFRFVLQTIAPLRFWADNADSTTVSYRSREL